MGRFELGIQLQGMSQYLQLALEHLPVEGISLRWDGIQGCNMVQG